MAPPPPPPPPPPPAPAPPPPPPVVVPVVPTKSDTMKSTRSVKSTSSEAAMLDELKAVLPAMQRKLLDFKKTPDIFIDQKSNPDEVERWLEAKGFSDTARKQLRVPGHQLFGLSRAQLERVLGAVSRFEKILTYLYKVISDEGKRLYSQVLVQRNVSGYKTTSASELQSILRKVREKVEVS